MKWNILLALHKEVWDYRWTCEAMLVVDLVVFVFFGRLSSLHDISIEEICDSILMESWQRALTYNDAKQNLSRGLWVGSDSGTDPGLRDWDRRG